MQKYTQPSPKTIPLAFRMPIALHDDLMAYLRQSNRHYHGQISHLVRELLAEGIARRLEEVSDAG